MTRSKLTDTQVRLLYERRKNGHPLRGLAREVGLSEPSLYARFQKIEMQDLRQRVVDLEDENARLLRAMKGHIGGPNRSPTRDAILAALDDGELMTYADLAEAIGSTADRVKGAVNGMKGQVEKFTDGRGRVHVRKVSE